MGSGKVYIVGAGPGDPELITLKALGVIRKADVILYDRLVHPDLVNEAPPRAIRHYVGKEPGQTQRQARIHRLLLGYARQGKTVVRLKGGDPFVFGRGSEEAIFLARHGVAVEVIPGVSSSFGVPASIGIPLTHRGLARGFAVVTGQCSQSGSVDWRAYAHADTLVILMGVKNRQAIARALIESGKDPATPTVFIEKGCTSEERVVAAPLKAVAQGEVEARPPAVWVIGEVVRLREEVKPQCRSNLTAASS